MAGKVSESTLRVILLHHTPHPEEVVAMAAKLCYSPSNLKSLKKRIKTKDQKGFVEKLMKMGHMSPIEHASFTFVIEGLSRACSHQLVRHRLASYSQQSQRYISEEKGFDYIIPPTIKADRELKKYFKDFMVQSQKTYNEIVKRLHQRGIRGELANQDARFVLPNAVDTKIMVTMNARELLHFFRMRCCNRSQWEIRQMAEEMLKIGKKMAPKIFENGGPACLSGPCPEGEYSCGKLKGVREKYRRMRE
jgi:thymidylate synthase (FAD)